MSLFRCDCTSRCDCVLVSLIASIIAGILAAFFQITAVITLTPVFLWVSLGIAVAYLAVVTVAAALAEPAERTGCLCETLNALLTGILGTILLALVLLAVGIVATSVVSAILVGLLVFFFALIPTATACFVRQLVNCGS